MRTMDKPLSKYNQQQRDKAMPRARKIAKMRNAGKTFPEIGEIFDITPQRAQQLYLLATAMRNIE